MNKLTFYLIIAVVLLSGALFGTWKVLADKNKQLKDKNVIITEEAQTYRTKFNTEAVKASVWQVKYNDVKTILGQKDEQLTFYEREVKRLALAVEGMGIKLNRVETAITAGFDSSIDTTLTWRLDSLTALNRPRTRSAELVRGSLTVKVTDLGKELKLLANQHLSIYAGLYNTKKWKSGKEIKHPFWIFWKKYQINGAITTNDPYIKIDSVLFLNPNR